MVNSLAKIENGAESCGLDAWTDYCKSEIQAKLPKIQMLRDPLKKTSFREEQVVSVYGYYVDGSNCNLVYFWERNLKSISWSDLTRTSARQSILDFGILLGEIQARNPNLQKAREFLSEDIVEKIPSADEHLEGKNLYWASFGKMKMACLYEDSRMDGRAEHRSSIGLLECLAFHHDYFKFRSPVWNSVPLRFLFSGERPDFDFFHKVLLHPRCFNPEVETPDGSFLWPWQRCIYRRGGDCGDIAYKSRTTTSVVFDLRKSTVALEQLRSRDLAEFSPFIKKVVEDAKSLILRHGGFFDKETGDGIVGHFVDFDTSGDQLNFSGASQRAFEAAVEIVRSTSLTCDNFQKGLRLGVGMLGAGVGIHTGDAVWIVEDNQVRAIGDSVILAARLCNEAPSSGIFLSNSQFMELGDTLGTELSAQFVKRSYEGKEVKGGAGLYGYALAISDLF